MRKTSPRTVEIDRGRKGFGVLGHSTGMMMNAIVSQGGEGHLRHRRHEDHVRRGRHRDPPLRRDVNRLRRRDATPRCDVRRRRLLPKQKIIIMVIFLSQRMHRLDLRPRSRVRQFKTSESEPFLLHRGLTDRGF